MYGLIAMSQSSFVGSAWAGLYIKNINRKAYFRHFINTPIVLKIFGLDYQNNYL